MKQYVACIFSIGLALGTANCGDDAGDAISQFDWGNEPVVAIAYSPMYSAYIDDDHPCRIPAITVGNLPGVQWSASDESMVQFERDTNGGTLITTRKPGSVDIVARAGAAAQGKAWLTITPFTVEEWEAGKRRYDSDVPYEPPHSTGPIMAAFDEALREADGGPPDTAAALSMFVPPPGTACTSCHGASKIAIDFTPQQVGGYSDEDLARIITAGDQPSPSLLSRLPPPIMRLLHQESARDIDPPLLNGLIAYIRSLEPAAGPSDFDNDLP